MSHHNDSTVYISGDFSEPMHAQHNFANHFDLENPMEAMASYNRIMHEHTKRQLSTATDSARRRSQSVSSSPESRGTSISSSRS